MTDWIEHKGDGVPTLKKVDIRYRDGSELQGVTPRVGSACWDWSKDKEPYYADIVAYRIHSEPTKAEGSKFDSGKPRLGLISSVALVEEAGVLAMGADKYGSHNWRGGIAWSRLYDAIQRHLVAWNAGEDIDPESGKSHLAHARCSLGFLLEYAETHKELDDRYKGAYEKG